jgi:hypothetical protein
MAEVKMTPIAQNEDDKPEKLEKVIKGEIVKKKAKPALLDEFVKEEPSYVKEYSEISGDRNVENFPRIA